MRWLGRLVGVSRVGSEVWAPSEACLEPPANFANSGAAIIQGLEC